MTTNNVTVTVTADDQTQAGLDAAQGNVTSFSDQVGGILAGGGVVAGGMLAMGIASAMDLSSARTNLETQFNLTGETAEKAGEVVGEVFTNGFGESAAEVSNAVGAIQTSIGDLSDFSKAEIESMTESALALGKTFEMDIGEASTAAGHLIKQGLVKDGQEAFDVLTKAAQTLPKSMVADIPAIVTEYGTHFKRIGLDAQTSFGMMSQFVKAGGRDIDQAADVLHEFARITSEETERAAEGFKALKLDAGQMLDDIGKGGKPAADALGLTLEKLRDIKDPAERAKLQVALFGDMAGEAADALLAMDPASAGAASGMDKAAGAAKSLTDKMEASPAQQMDAAMRTLQETLGELLLPVVKEVGAFLSDHKEAIEQWAPLVLGLGAAFAIASVGVWAMNSALLANPMVWIIAAIIAIVILAIAYWDEFKAGAEIVWEKIKEAWNKIKEKTAELWETIKAKFNKVKEKWEEVKRKAGEIKQSIKEKWEDLLGFFRRLPGRISKAAGGMWDGIKNSFRSAINWLIGRWNGFSLRIGGGSIMGVDIPSITLHTPNIPYLAVGGLVGGGRGNQVVVGEYGPEMVTLPSGSRVSTASSTRQMFQQGGGGGPLHITLVVGDRQLAEILVDPLRKVVRSKGGNVQAVLGS